MKNFAKTLVKLRKKAGLSQNKLALKIKMSRPFINQLESGARGPAVETIQKLAKALGVPPGDLMQ